MEAHAAAGKSRRGASRVRAVPRAPRRGARKLPVTGDRVGLPRAARGAGCAEEPTRIPVAESPPPPPPPKPRRPERKSVLMSLDGLLLAASFAAAAVQLREGRNANPERLRTITSGRCSPSATKAQRRSPQLLIGADHSAPAWRARDDDSYGRRRMALALERRRYMAGPPRRSTKSATTQQRAVSPFRRGSVQRANAHKYAREPERDRRGRGRSCSAARCSRSRPQPRPGGPVPIVSPSTTYVGLTRRVRSQTRISPAFSFYPTGRRNYGASPSRPTTFKPPLTPSSPGGRRQKRSTRSTTVSRLSVVCDDFVRATRRLGAGVGSRAVGHGMRGQRSYASLPLRSRKRRRRRLLGVSSVPASIRLLRELRARV